MFSELTIVSREVIHMSHTQTLDSRLTIHGEGSIVQGIEREFPKLEIQVRVLVELQEKAF
jgi:hypothetical protein